MANRLVMMGSVIAGIVLVGTLIGGIELGVIIPIGVGLAIVAVIGDMAARREDVEATGPAGSIASLIQASGIALALVALWVYTDNPLDTAIEYWWVLPLGVVLVFGYWYAQHRRQVATAETAINRTQRTATRTISDWTSFILGIGVLTLTAGFAVLQGFGDALAPYGGEIAYLFTVGLGYVSLGGDAGSWGSYIPELAPLQWVGLTLFVGGIALYIQSQA